MSNMVNINFRVEEDVKKQCEALYNELGLNMSTALTAFMKQSLRYGGIPFELQVNSTDYSDKVLRAVKRLNNGEGVEHGLIEVD